MSSVTLDGGLGEGGGQILRSALALASITGRPLEIRNIRARRARPGLARQHLTCVQAAAALVDAELSGAELRSKRLRFAARRPVRAGSYTFDIGTAGSTGLVFQTVLWPLAMAGGDSEVTIIGGTHNPMSPPYDFLADAFLPVIRRAGIEVELELERHGFNPAGGGRVHARIRGGSNPSQLVLVERGGPREMRARILVADLPRDVAERERRVICRNLELEDEAVEIVELSGCGPGNAVIVTIEHPNVREVITGFGEKRVRAEVVAGQVATEAHTYLSSDAPVGEHLADQLIIGLALAGRGELRCATASQHTRTNIEVVQSFVDVDFALEREASGPGSYRLTARSAIR